ncbi:MAG TPA: hypothetical protein PLS96_08035 [Myxococcota bacterium]|nr:hypothetical protein [Myxococcota bacterium]
MFVIHLDDFSDSIANLFDIVENPYMDNLIFQSPVETLGNTVGLGLLNKWGGRCKAPEDGIIVSNTYAKSNRRGAPIIPAPVL